MTTTFLPSACRLSLLLLLAAAGLWFCSPAAADEPAKLRFPARNQVETAPESGRFHVLSKPLDWRADQTAVVICDMWDQHWCPSATARVGEMAPRMNEVAKKLRSQGVLIIHCPSDTLDFYKDHPGRKLAQQAPKVETKLPLQAWCSLQNDREPPLPIDDRDGGCDGQPNATQRRAWSRQHPAIDVAEGDAITDSAEAYYLMRQRGITNVIVMGVHTNMCVLGRPFGIRQMVQQGQNVVLMRDMTDTMYNSRSRPYVSHFTGTDLVVSHIERHWCPSITSAAVLGDEEFRFAADKRPHVVIVAAEDEYQSDQTLPAFAQQWLGRDFRTSYVFADQRNRNNLPGLEVLNEADLAILSIRRRTLPKDQLDILREYVQSGRPLVALRTTSHAFCTLDQQPPGEPLDHWPEFDRQVLGCHYTGHFNNKGEGGPQTFIKLVPAARNHPITAGLPTEELPVRSWLYKSRPLADAATRLLSGRVGEAEPEPVAWTYQPATGNRVFYTSLGHPADFEQAAFQRLLLGGIFWAVDRPMPDWAAQKLTDSAAAAKATAPGTSD